jgi:hypothetical protein
MLTTSAHELRQELAGEVGLGIEVFNPREHVLQSELRVLVILGEWGRKSWGARSRRRPGTRAGRIVLGVVILVLRGEHGGVFGGTPTTGSEMRG